MRQTFASFPRPVYGYSEKRQCGAIWTRCGASLEEQFIIAATCIAPTPAKTDRRRALTTSSTKPGRIAWASPTGDCASAFLSRRGGPAACMPYNNWEWSSTSGDGRLGPRVQPAYAAIAWLAARSLDRVIGGWAPNSRTWLHTYPARRRDRRTWHDRAVVRCTRMAGARCSPCFLPLARRTERRLLGSSAIHCEVGLLTHLHS